MSSGFTTERLSLVWSRELRVVTVTTGLSPLDCHHCTFLLTCYSTDCRLTRCPCQVPADSSLATPALQNSARSGGRPPPPFVQPQLRILLLVRGFLVLSHPHTTGTIASRKPANIPLHTLSNSSRHHERVPSSPSDSLDEKHERGRRPSHESDSAGSDFSLWSDTGDLVDQLADEEDPLRARTRPSVDEDQIGLVTPNRKRGRRPRRVHYSEQEELARKEGHTGEIKRKEDIVVPSPTPQPVGGAHKLLAIIMAPTDGHARMHGLHGKKLM